MTACGLGRLLLVVALGFVAGCATPSARKSPAPLILVSVDAFRWDYTRLYPEQTPQLRALIREGVTTDGLIPVFPSNTFPNHYSIATGLYPARHGIINNQFFDPVRGEFFRYNRPGFASDPSWWGGEPIWNTVMRQNGQAACWFWPGSEAPIGGMRPAIWKRWDPTLSFEARLTEMIGWLSRVDRSRPAIATFYLEETNSVGHKFGPDSPELAAAVKQADDRMGELRARLRAAGIEANLVIVSDHGMTPISPSRVILLDEFIKPADVQLDFDGPVAGLRPLRGTVEDLVRALTPVRHAKVYRAEDLPAHFRLRDNPRIPPVWLVPEEGWEIYWRNAFEGFRDRMNRGDHGYDPALRSMHGIFIAHGPAFRRAVHAPPTESVHVYHLLCAALGVAPAPNDGDDRLARRALR